MQRLQAAYNEQGQKIDYDYPETRPEINCSTIEYMAGNKVVLEATDTLTASSDTNASLDVALTVLEIT